MNPYVELLIGQEPMAINVIDFQREPTSITLLNRHNIKPTHSDLLLDS